MKKLIISLFLLLSLYSCIGKIVIGLTKKPIKNVEMSFLKDSNVEFVRQGLPGVMKFSEGLYEYEPNGFYASKLSFLYGAYSFAFFDSSPFDDFDIQTEVLKHNMMDFYNRSYEYGMKSMDFYIKDFSKNILLKDYTVLEKVKKKHVEALFWLTFSWAMKILNDTSDPFLVAQLDTIKVIMDKIKGIYPDYMDGAVYAVYVAYYGGRTQVIGGDPVKTEEYYEEGKQFSRNKSLILDYVYLRYVTIQYPNSSKFDKVYREVKSFSSDDEDNRFINSLILEKADTLYKKKSDLFN